jgi:hypothetical protein
VSRIHLKLGEKAFTIAAPKAWNRLPRIIKKCKKSISKQFLGITLDPFQGYEGILEWREEREYDESPFPISQNPGSVAGTLHNIETAPLAKKQ